MHIRRQRISGDSKVSDEKSRARGSVLSNRTNFRVGGVMEKVNAMKKIALFMMIVGLAVAMVACQGAVGPAGNDGTTGPQGPLGPPGQLGPEGPTPLVAKTGLGPVLLVNDIKKADGTVAVGGPKTFDIASEFSGGVGVTYKAVKSTGDADETTSQYEISLTGSVLTVTLTSAAMGKSHVEPVLGTQVPPELALGGAFDIVLSATSDGVTVTRSLYVVRNQAPRTVVPGVADIVRIENVRLGSQDAPRDTTFPHKDWLEDDPAADTNTWPAEQASENDYIQCSMLNVCTITVMMGADGAANVSFQDEGALTYTATADKANVTVASAPDGKSIILTGVTTTVTAAGANTFATEGVTVTVTATDGGRLSSTNYLKVIVDDRPSIVTDLPTSFDIPADAEGTPPEIIIPLAPYVKDSESTPVNFFLADASRATSNFATAAIDATTMTVMAGAFKGSRTFTIRVYEPRVEHPVETPGGGVGQWYDFTLTVNNKSGL